MQPISDGMALPARKPEPEARTIYLPGLNGVRFLAAAAVFIHHAEQFKGFADLPHNYTNRWVHSFGPQGVDLFFVLSGFLITYLLAAELEQRGRISIPKFIFRRACRILPLYYLVITIGFLMLLVLWPVEESAGGIDAFVLAKRRQVMDHFWPILKLYLFMLPNLVYPRFDFVLFNSQAWSIGVEEQFYLVWPWILKFVRPGRWAHAFVGVIAVKLFVTSIAQDHLLKSYLYYARFEDMAVGALGGWLLFYHRDFIQKHLISRWLQPVAGPALVVVLGYGGTCEPAAPLLPPFCYMILLLHLTTSPYRYLNLEIKPFSYLGKISYGLYMYHILAIMISLRIVTQFASKVPPETFLDWLALNFPHYLLSAVITVGLAAGSYRFYESYFLHLKGKFGSLSTDESPAAPARGAAGEAPASREAVLAAS